MSAGGGLICCEIVRDPDSNFWFGSRRGVVARRSEAGPGRPGLSRFERARMLSTKLRLV